MVLLFKVSAHTISSFSRLGLNTKRPFLWPFTRRGSPIGDWLEFASTYSRTWAQSSSTPKLPVFLRRRYNKLSAKGLFLPTSPSETISFRPEVSPQREESCSDLLRFLPADLLMNRAPEKQESTIINVWRLFTASRKTRTSLLGR